MSVTQRYALPWRAIDPHVHCRDEEQRQKTTIAEVLALASSQGVDIIFDMPNTERPVIDRHRVAERLALVPKGHEWRYRLYVGLTGDEAQIMEALWCYQHIPEVIGLKMYAGKSVGDLSVVDMDAQRNVYRVLAREKYQGVLAVHCEKESLMRPDLWDAANPITHGWARSEESEVESVKDQIRFALAEGYAGRLHICHVSCPSLVWLVKEAKDKGLRISCEVTPHHIMWNDFKMAGTDGLFYKMNPPLRCFRSMFVLREQLCEGMIDVIATDHAVHTPEEKGIPQCLSGFPAMEVYGDFTRKFLPGIGVSEALIRAMTRDNILEIFKDKLDGG